MHSPHTWDANLELLKNYSLYHSLFSAHPLFNYLIDDRYSILAVKV